MHKRIHWTILLLTVIALVGCKPEQTATTNQTNAVFLLDNEHDNAVLRRLLGVRTLKGEIIAPPGETNYVFEMQFFEDGEPIKHVPMNIGIETRQDRIIHIEVLWGELDGKMRFSFEARGGNYAAGPGDPFLKIWMATFVPSGQVTLFRRHPMVSKSSVSWRRG